MGICHGWKRDARKPAKLRTTIQDLGTCDPAKLRPRQELSLFKVPATTGVSQLDFGQQYGQVSSFVAAATGQAWEEAGCGGCLGERFPRE